LSLVKDRTKLKKNIERFLRDYKGVNGYGIPFYTYQHLSEKLTDHMESEINGMVSETINMDIIIKHVDKVFSNESRVLAPTVENRRMLKFFCRNVLLSIEKSYGADFSNFLTKYSNI